MPPIIIKEECNACGICADICPTDVFRIANKGDIPEIKYPEECWHCNACVLDCKPSAIKLRIPLPAMMLHVGEDRMSHQSLHPSVFTSVFIFGSKNDLRTKSMLQDIYRAYLPNKILSLKDPQELIEGSWFPFFKEKGNQEVPTTFLCKGFTCLPPVRNEKELKKILE